MANMYRSVLSGGGTAPTGDAVAADVLSGKTFSNASATGITGTMVNNGAVSGRATPSQPYTIPAGYHNGEGTVTASKEDRTIYVATPDSAHILFTQADIAGYHYIKLLTGTMPDGQTMNVTSMAFNLDGTVDGNVTTTDRDISNITITNYLRISTTIGNPYIGVLLHN